MKTKIAVLLLLVSLPTVSYGYYRVDRSDLDDDIVEEFPIPVLFGVDYEDVNPDFGDPRSGGRTHEGEDMLAPQGTPIVSPTEAIVTKVGRGSSAGNYVYTANPGGETFRYMHLEDIANLDEGDELGVGDYIGTVGDTGNAPDGVYHLHFEVRDENNKAQDPYDRLDKDGFTLKKKASFLRDIFRDRRDDEDYAEFLVETFPADFSEALRRGYSLPSVIDNALEDSGVVDEAEKIESLTKLIASLPAALNVTLENGDSGVLVVLLQIYLIYTGEGEARDRLFAAGPTGYFGSITEAALLEHQREYLTKYDKGIYNSVTQKEMLDRDNISLNLNY